ASLCRLAFEISEEANVIFYLFPNTRNDVFFGRQAFLFPCEAMPGEIGNKMLEIDAYAPFEIVGVFQNPLSQLINTRNSELLEDEPYVIALECYIDRITQRNPLLELVAA